MRSRYAVGERVLRPAHPAASARRRDHHERLQLPQQDRAKHRPHSAHLAELLRDAIRAERQAGGTAEGGARVPVRLTDTSLGHRPAAGAPAVTSVGVDAFEVPLGSPESDGTLTWDSTTLVVVDACGPGARSGSGYTYAAPAAGLVVVDTAGRRGRRPRRRSTSARLRRAMAVAVRNLGWSGICAAAISAVDIALNDLTARLLDIPLATYVGGARDRVMAYGSGGFTSYSEAQLERQVGGWARRASCGEDEGRHRPGGGPRERRRTTRESAATSNSSWTRTERTPASRPSDWPRCSQSRGVVVRGAGLERRPGRAEVAARQRPGRHADRGRGIRIHA